MNTTDMSMGDDDTIMAINGTETKKIKKAQRKIQVEKLLCWKETDAWENELVRELTCRNTKMLSDSEASVDLELMEVNMRLQKLENALKSAGRRYPVRLLSDFHTVKRHEHPQLGSREKSKSSIHTSREEQGEEEEDRPPRIIFRLPVVYDVNESFFCIAEARSVCVSDIDEEVAALTQAQEE
jgi:hypothetical protein